MMDLFANTLLGNTLLLSILLAAALVVIALLIIYALYLRRTLRELRIMCSTDDNLRRILKVTDDLLGKLSQEDVEGFVSSPDFELYKQVMHPIVAAKKENAPAPAKKQGATATPAPSSPPSTQRAHMATPAAPAEAPQKSEAKPALPPAPAAASPPKKPARSERARKGKGK